MKRVTYVGRDDARILDGHDLNKADVTGFSKTEFQKGIPVEVKNEVAYALITNGRLFGEFIIEEDEERDAPAGEEPAKTDEKQDKTPANTEVPTANKATDKK
jgi:hypothetical protein